MDKKRLTMSSGTIVGDDENSITMGKSGPIALQDTHLIEKIAHFNRERIPERVVHARGAAAYGAFTLTKTLSGISIADFLQRKGDQTKVFVRFSVMGGDNSASDTVRDQRGFAVRFYTNEGNYDVVGNNTPVFFLRDPIKFPDFIHTQKPCPVKNIANPDAMWDFWSQNPQALHQLTVLMSDRGIPTSYRHMHGYGSHTFGMWNDKGERFWVKWHFKTNQGIKALNNEEAADIAGERPYAAQEDLYESIENGCFPSWSVKIQIMPEKHAATYPFAFDATKVWSHKDYPLIEVGQLELNRNPDDYFAEVEQSALSPSNFVPGIGASPDRVLQARLFAYPDAQRYRLGTNYNTLSVNKPLSDVCNYQRAGAMSSASGQNKKSYGTYDNASLDGQEHPSSLAEYCEPHQDIHSGELGRFDHREDCNDYIQAGDLFRLMSGCQKNQLVMNIANSLSNSDERIQVKMLQHFDKADPEYGFMVREALFI